MNGLADQLRVYIETIEQMEVEKLVVSDRIKGVYEEAAARGFDKRTIKRIITLRRMSSEVRREQDALEWIYRASLGMLDGASLPEFALERLSRTSKPSDQRGLFEKQEPQPEHSKPDDQEPREAGHNETVSDEDTAKNETQAASAESPADTATDAEPESKAPEPTIDDAREMGRVAAQTGKPVTDNPFPARDPRRAAFDEEWCKAAGSDGMEIPEAWRRNAKKKDQDASKEAET
jgi:uncharacterized protein (UPF0335 family)